VFVEQHSQFAKCHTVPRGDWKQTDERGLLRFENIPRDVNSVNWIRPIANNDLLTKLARRHHGVCHRICKRIDAAAHVLHVKHQDIKVFQHRFGRFASFTVKRMNGQARLKVNRVLAFNHVVL
jgi:hypothetical protein